MHDDCGSCSGAQWLLWCGAGRWGTINGARASRLREGWSGVGWCGGPWQGEQGRYGRRHFHAAINGLMVSFGDKLV